jgi:dTDP-4-dehydrorhamnose reductase
MRILIIGFNGMLGKDLPQEWSEDDVIPATSRDADIHDCGQVRQLVTQAHPDWIVLTAAYTDVDGSEQNSELAFAVNGEGMKNVACVAQEDGAKVFYVRRDYLFDGNHPIEPKRPIAPLNVYGRSKAAGEKAIQENHSAWCIARTSWLFGDLRRLSQRRSYALRRHVRN